MALSQAELNIILRAQDRASAQIAAVEQRMNRLGATAHAIGGRFRMLGAIIQGTFQGIGQAVFFTLQRQLSRLVSILPDLIARGEAWGETIDRISDSTGIAAERASELAAVTQFLGIGTDQLGMSLARFARNAVDSAEQFHRLGVDIAFAADGSVDMWQTLQNLRDAVNDSGASAETSARLMALLGRAGFEATDMLTLQDDAWNAITRDARISGLVMTQAQLDTQQALQRTRNHLDGVLTGLGTQIMLGVAPALSGLIEGISRTIQQNMDAIVRFSVQVVNFIAGLVSGLFGFNLATVTLADSVGKVQNSATRLGGALPDVGERARKAADGEDKLTKSLNRQIEAIDNQIEAIDRREHAHDTARERQELVGDIEAMRQQLADLQTEGVFTAGMSEAEAELARQKAAADILDAQESLSDATDRLAEHDRDEAARRRREELQDTREALQDQLTAHQKHLRDLGKAQDQALDRWLARLRKQPASPWGTSVVGNLLSQKGLTGALTQAAEDAKAAGQEFANKIRDFLTGAGSLVGFIGGLVGKLNIVIPALAALRLLGGGGLGAGAGAGMLTPVLIGAFAGIALDQFVRAEAAMLRAIVLTPGQNSQLSQSGLSPLLGLGNDPLIQTLLGPSAFGGWLAELGRIGDSAETTNRNLSPGSALLRTFTDLLGITQPIADNTEQAMLTAEEARELVAGVAQNTLDAATRLAIGVGITNTPDVKVPGGVNVTNVPDVKVPGGVNAWVTNPSLGINGGVSVTNAPDVKVPGGVNVINTPDVKVPGGVNVGNKVEISNPALSGMTFVGNKLAVATKGKGSPPPGCFVAGTLVATPAGAVPIEQIAVGDLVYAVDTDSMERVESHVLAVLPHPANEEPRLLVALSDGRTIHTTGGHRFYDPSLGDFHPISEFSSGDSLLDFSDGRREVWIEWIDYLGKEPTDVYNLTVAIHQNYLVEGILVHNVKQNAAGLLGMADSPFDLGVMGEAGREAVAIIRNPKPLTSFGGGTSNQPAVFHIHVDLDKREIAEVVVDYMNGHIGRSSSLQPGR